MKNLSKIAKLYTNLTLVMLVYLTLPMVKYFTNIHAALAIGLFCIGSIILYPAFFKRTIFFFWCWYSLIIIFNYIAGDPNYLFNTTILQIIMSFSVFSITTYFIDKKDYLGFGIIVVVSISIALIVSITTIPQLLNNPKLIRNYAKEENYLEQQSIWLLTYGMLHGLPFLFPPLIYFIKNTLGTRRLLLIIALFVFFIVILLADATTSVMLGVLSIIISLVLNEKKPYKTNMLRIVIVIIPLIIFINTDVLLYILDLIQPFFSGFSTSNKINEFRSVLLYNNFSGDLGARQYLYQLSWDSFIENMTFGTNYSYGIGKHSYFLDQIAALGIVGFIPLILLIIEHVKIVYNQLCRTGIYYMIGVSCYLAMFAFKNVFSYEIYLYAFVFLPGICITIENITTNRFQLNRNYNDQAN